MPELQGYNLTPSLYLFILNILSLKIFIPWLNNKSTCCSIRKLKFSFYHPQQVPHMILLTQAPGDLISSSCLCRHAHTCSIYTQDTHTYKLKKTTLPKTYPLLIHLHKHVHVKTCIKYVLNKTMATI